MSIGDLFEKGTLSGFMLSNMDSGAFFSDRWYLIHIPKTAGSSLREELANVLQPDFNVEVDYKNLDANEVHKDFATKLRGAIDNFVNSPHFEKYRFASGHTPYFMLADKPRLKDWRKITFLRNPMARLESDYKYRTSPAHPTFEAEKARYPDFLAYIEDAPNRDVMFKFLRPTGKLDTPAESVIEQLVNDFSFVGVQEYYALSIRILFAILGKRVAPTFRLRRADQGGDGAQPIENIVAQYGQAVRNLNAKDYAIYDFFATRYDALKVKLFSEIDYDLALKKVSGVCLPRT